MWGRCVDASLSIPQGQAQFLGRPTRADASSLQTKNRAGRGPSVRCGSLWELCLRAGNVQLPQAARKSSSAPSAPLAPSPTLSPHPHPQQNSRRDPGDNASDSLYSGGAATMVHTSHHRALQPRPKQTHPTVVYWRAFEGLVFMGALPPAADTHRTAFSLLFSPSVAWPFGLWWGTWTEHEGVKDKRLRVSRPQLGSGSTSLPLPHFPYPGCQDWLP